MNWCFGRGNIATMVSKNWNAKTGDKLATPPLVGHWTLHNATGLFVRKDHSQLLKMFVQILLRTSVKRSMWYVGEVASTASVIEKRICHDQLRSSTSLHPHLKKHFMLWHQWFKSCYVGILNEWWLIWGLISAQNDDEWGLRWKWHEMTHILQIKYIYRYIYCLLDYNCDR